METDAGHFSAAWVTLALLALMATWWVTEAVPIPVTSLLPILVLPLFGISSISQVSAPYMHPIVVLLMGGFIFAKAIEKWGLHERIALHAVRLAGGSPAGMIGGFMFAAAILSMWISNSATSIMMMPIALSVAAAYEKGLDDKPKNFTYALLLGIAYACSIGGLGTPIGTPTNLIVLGYLNEHNNIDIGFAQWMMMGIPAVIILVPVAWFVLTRWVFKMPKYKAADAQKTVSDRLFDLGRMTVPEKRTLLVFLVIAALWAFRRPLNSLTISYGGDLVTPLAGLTDHMTAILAVLLCFLVPAGSKENKGQPLLDWKSAEQIPWGVLLLFGGGMSLAQAISSTGLSTYLGTSLSMFSSYPVPVVIFLIAALVLALTEVTSNIATASALMPVLGALAIETGLPLEMMAVPIALAASCAFMLPMATGPNAVVFATGKVSLSTMAKAGVRINLIAVVVITAISYYIAPIAFG
ncbi:MAG: DASS family sodium-coupled anion symporter [Arenicella sp.]|nr:DASS family sodium-coupled anion symporter [Arenicella sp.]